VLAANPSLARLREDFSPPVRLHPYGAHIVVYIAAEDVLIVRVLHSRQDWVARLSR
jgi:toxin ParE1/3/4